MHRPRVTALLDAHTRRPVTLVTGPAGTGKSLAVADWARDGGRAGTVVWVSLDRGDETLSRFWGSLLSALRVALPVTMGGLVEPYAPDAGFPQEVSARVGGNLTLVLDDAHLIDGN